MSRSMTFAPDRPRPLAWLGGLLLLGLLAGCGPAQVKVEGQFPEPLMEPLPLTVGVWYNEDFANHEFFDQAKSRNESSWVVKTGEAQGGLFSLHPSSGRLSLLQSLDYERKQQVSFFLQLSLDFLRERRRRRRRRRRKKNVGT